jgi:hypothetical protein
VPPRLARRGGRPAPQALSHNQVTPIALDLALLELPTPPILLFPGRNSPKQEAQWLVPVAAAARHRRQCLHSDQTLKPMCGEPLATPSLSPTDSGAGAPEFGPAPPPSMARGHIAKGRIFPGASAQKYFSNSVPFWLKLVKCVENRRKFRKIQNQFCWLSCYEYYNFCYSLMV